MIEASCPSCGAPVAFKNSASIFVVCAHCETMAVRRDANLDAVGKVADLQEDGSPIQLGAMGSYKGVKFEVIGRIQLRYDRGFWNEWFLNFGDGTQGWLGEAQGDYAMSHQLPHAHGLPPYAKLYAGVSVKIGTLQMTVKDLEMAHCVSGEGELPFEIRGGYSAPVADLIGPAGRFATIDYSEEPPLVFTGEYVDFDSLKLAGLKRFEGW